MPLHLLLPLLMGMNGERSKKIWEKPTSLVWSRSTCSKWQRVLHSEATDNCTHWNGDLWCKNTHTETQPRSKVRVHTHSHTDRSSLNVVMLPLSLSLSTIFSIYPHSTDFLSCFGHQKYSLRFHFTDGYINYIFFWRDAKDCMAFVEFENLNQKNSNTFFYNIINRCVNKWNRMNVCSAAAPALAAGAIVNCVHTIQKHIHLCSIQLQNAFAVPCNMILHFKMHLANQQVWVCVCVRMYVCMFVEWFRIYQLNGKVCVCMCYL